MIIDNLHDLTDNKQEKVLIKNALANKNVFILGDFNFHLPFENKLLNELKYNDEAVDLIAWRYQIKLADAMKWFGELEYAAKAELNEEEMNVIFGKLVKFKIIDAIPNIFDICYNKTVELA